MCSIYGDSEGMTIKYKLFISISKQAATRMNNNRAYRRTATQKGNDKQKNRWIIVCIIWLLYI